MKIKEVAAQVLEDAKVYLDAITPDVYARQLDLLFGASIGQHTRHFVEFFQCLLDQLEGPHPVIDYARRLRNFDIETDPATARETITIIRSRILAMQDNIPCQLACDEHFTGTERLAISSNLERELVYNIEHTIHHLAIIKIGLAIVAPQLKLPSHFGVAPSTVQFKQGICAQ